MQVGDEVTFKKPHYDGAMKVHNATRFTIVEISDEWLKLKHPEVGGYFVFSMDLVDEVFPKKKIFFLDKLKPTGYITNTLRQRRSI